MEPRAPTIYSLSGRQEALNSISELIYSKRPISLDKPYADKLDPIQIVDPETKHNAALAKEVQCSICLMIVKNPHECMTETCAKIFCLDCV